MLNLAGAPGTTALQQGMAAAGPSVGGNPWASANQPNLGMGVMGMSQPSIPQNQTPLGHTLAPNLWQ